MKCILKAVGINKMNTNTVQKICIEGGRLSPRVEGLFGELGREIGNGQSTRVVLTASPIYLLIAIDLPKWVFKAVDKRRRGFLWKGQQ